MLQNHAQHLNTFSGHCFKKTLRFKTTQQHLNTVLGLLLLLCLKTLMTGTLWLFAAKLCIAKLHTTCQHSLGPLICISTHPWVTDFENFVAKPFTACQHTALRSLICVSTHPWVTDMETYVVPENANVKYILWVFAANSCVAKPRTASQHLNTLLDHALIWKALSCFNTPMSEKTCLLLFCRFDINKGIMWTGVALMASRSVHHSFYNSYITFIHFG